MESRRGQEELSLERETVRDDLLEVRRYMLRKEESPVVEIAEDVFEELGGVDTRLHIC